MRFKCPKCDRSFPTVDIELSPMDLKPVSLRLVLKIVLLYGLVGLGVDLIRCLLNMQGRWGHNAKTQSEP